MATLRDGLYPITMPSGQRGERNDVRMPAWMKVMSRWLSDPTPRDSITTGTFASRRDAGIAFGICVANGLVERGGRLWIICDPSGIAISSQGDSLVVSRRSRTG